MRNPAFVACLFALCIAGSNAGNLIIRNYFFYMLANNTKTNQDKITTNLNALVRNVKNRPISGAFGPDAGLQPLLGYSSLNSHYAGWVDFKNVANFTAYFAELATNKYYLEIKKLISGASRIQTLHTIGDESLYNNKTTYYRVIFAYRWDKLNVSALMDADRVLGDLHARTPYPSISGNIVRDNRLRLQALRGFSLATTNSY